MITEAIYTILSGNAGLIAAIPATKIFPINAPQETNVPLLIFDISRTDPEDTKDGYNIEHIYLEVDVFDRSPKTAYTNADLVKTALNRYSGTVNSAAIDTIIFEGLNPARFNEDRLEYQVSLGFRIRQKI